MSGGPPHHPHNRQGPPSNPAWNHLQVPSYFPGQPQLAHSSNEHMPYQYQPTWHKPALPSEAMKMFKMEPLFPRDCVDLSRNGNQNGELSLTSSPISLSVRDTNKINSLPASALEIQPVELTKPLSPKIKNVEKSVSPGLKSMSPVASPVSIESKCQKRAAVRVDSILERLNTNNDKNVNVGVESAQIESVLGANEKVEKTGQSVIVQASNFDENSSSSSISNVPTSTSVKDDDAASMHSNEDSLDGNKSRRKRKPSKTVRVSKDEEITVKDSTVVAQNDEKTTETNVNQPENDPICISSILEGDNKVLERRHSSDDLDSILPAKTRRKTSSESETIDDIAAMVQEGLKEKEMKAQQNDKTENLSTTDKTEKTIVTSVVTKENESLNETTSDSKNESEILDESINEVPTTTLLTAAQKKVTTTSFVEVENKLEEMFAGIEDMEDSTSKNGTKYENSKSESNVDVVNKLQDDSLVKLDDDTSVVPSTSQDVTSTNNVETKVTKVGAKKRSTVKKRGGFKKKKVAISNASKVKNKKITVGNGKQNAVPLKEPIIKDVYAYDSGSNTSSTKSKGPFIQIKGPRDSPISVNVVNTPTNDDDSEKRANKIKKYHDDSEYRHKVRSKGLHCSTLSNKYDAQTKDATWICAFCKRGPHANNYNSSTGIVPLGDLFGPYFITGQCPEFERRLDDPYDKQFKSKKISKAILAEVVPPAKSSKKQKRKHSEAEIDENYDIYLGINDTGSGTFEIWAHEDCIVWSPGVYLVGPKIVGFEEAVWSACNVICKVCGVKGANICCLRRGCLSAAHLCCARQNEWAFDDGTFRAYCPEHKALV